MKSQQRFKSRFKSQSRLGFGHHCYIPFSWCRWVKRFKQQFSRKPGFTIDTYRRHDASVEQRALQAQARFPFKRNRLRCVRCVNENRKKRKRLRWQAANHGCHCFDRAFLLAGACVCCVKFCQRKRLRFLRFSFTQRTQRKRLRLNGNWASLCVWTTSSAVVARWSTSAKNNSRAFGVRAFSAAV